VARQVGHDDAMLGGERRCETAPVLDRPAEPVHEYDGWPVPTDRITKPGSAPLELALLESFQPGFAVRHQ
jgi:hypothetical protein